MQGLGKIIRKLLGKGISFAVDAARVADPGSVTIFGVYLGSKKHRFGLYVFCICVEKA